ncbi:MAG: hypothetical protein E2604_01635 [Flavobacterium sp.]|nr:hypothetical protein [Flavobacterium sp.]
MNQEQEEIFKNILNESAKRLLVVKTLSNFFNHKDLLAVYIRTKVIHNLFKSNPALDPNKLDLFHIQYTTTLIELFQKLKKAKEQQYLLVSDEIYINQDLIDKLGKEAQLCDYKAESKKHSANMSEKLRQLYNMLSEGKIVEPFSWNDIMVFSAKLAREFYREISGEQFLQLTNSSNRKSYHNEYITIEKKLLGRLNVRNFRIKLRCGVRFGDEMAEVFEFIDSNDSFVFSNSTKSFFLMEEENERGIDLSRNLSNKNSIVHDLSIKNEELKNKLGTIKTALPPDVEDVLAGYLEKITAVDFMDELQNVDEQTNILRAMLNININSK